MQMSLSEMQKRRSSSRSGLATASFLVDPFRERRAFYAFILGCVGPPHEPAVVTRVIGFQADQATGIGAHVDAERWRMAGREMTSSPSPTLRGPLCGTAPGHFVALAEVALTLPDDR